jgi:hypothetical protein
VSVGLVRLSSVIPSTNGETLRVLGFVRQVCRSKLKAFQTADFMVYDME